MLQQLGAYIRDTALRIPCFVFPALYSLLCIPCFNDGDNIAQNSESDILNIQMCRYIKH